ncbi:MAG: PSD1 and planctomycete cytochrome C domain-containing protein [Planctomycetaceae bacterium]
MLRKLVLALTITLSNLTGCNLAVLMAQTPVDYLRDVKPILQQRCYACHGALKQEAGLRLDTGEFIRHGGDKGSTTRSAAADTSLLIHRITATDDSERMPPEGEPLTNKQIEILKQWISQGAISPENELPEPDPDQHWAFQQPQRPDLKEVAELTGSSNPIDASIEAALAQRQLTCLPEAPKHVLLRRVYLDLIGLPPTRSELNAFLNDDSSNAYETVVDKLLNDPRHGERWARHWMDIWRYSDWYGRRYVPDVWNSAPQLWRWRDWIVQSLNADHGYDRMLREMLAADEICPEDDSAAVATGYLIRNWYALNPNDWMRNTVEHTGKAFLGLTFNCAHCHDHKYDPITQEDYFHLRAFFEPIDIRQDRVPGEADPGPFQEYSYGVLRKIQRLGAVRIYDRKPDAPTWFYTGGDERRRVTERGSVAPGVPTFLTTSAPAITPIDLPPRAWYPGLRPALHDALLSEAGVAVVKAESELAAAGLSSSPVPDAALDHLSRAESAFKAAVEEAKKAGRPGAIAGQHSLVLDATTGRRTLLNGLPQLTALEDGTTLTFELQILNDAHVNFQLAKDVGKGLTAAYIGFKSGRIISYQPGTFTEFETGKYDFTAGQSRFHVTLVIETRADRCLLSVKSVTDERLLVDQVPVALNGWNPIGDPSKAISFDCQTGCVAVIDDVTFAAPVPAGAVSETLPGRLFTFDFEAPVYSDGTDINGVEGWSIASYSVAPATSIVSSTALNESLRGLLVQVQEAERAVDAVTLPLRAAKVKLAAARADLTSIEARIAADRSKYGETPTAEFSDLARIANQAEREANVLQAEANVLAHELALATAEAKPMEDKERTKEIDAANKLLASSRPLLEKARVAVSGAATEEYTPFSPSYPKTSTGRRRALAEWITGRANPLTARVAVNHIWARHFHAPLVATVTDFGRSGALPTNPQLLDWMAVELMEHGWSMKHLHRLIVTSAAYRRQSTGAEGETVSDRENKLLWRMNVGRMEAEVLRDSLLYTAGKLDLTMGGQELENSDALKTFRRSLYYAVYPEEGGKSSLGELFDAPDAMECYRRTRSVVPQQALALTNSDFVHELSVTLSAMLTKENGDTSDSAPEAFITTAFEMILSRKPSVAELQLCRDAYRRQFELLTKSSATNANARARESIVRAILNHNDFITIR